MIDEQSNASFCDAKVINYFKPHTWQEDYTLSTLNAKIQVKGEAVNRIQVRGYNQEGEYRATATACRRPKTEKIRLAMLHILHDNTLAPNAHFRPVIR